MDYLKKYGIKPYINAHDTITLYGASRMAKNTKEAMEQISTCFVDMEKLQVSLGRHIAEITRNEAAYITNGASGALQLCAAVCMAEGDTYSYMHLPDVTGLKNEFLVFAGQHNCYDKAIEAAGGTICLIGDADETPDYELMGRIHERTAGVLYVPSIKYKWSSLELKKTIEIAHKKDVPVIVDAAAQLPPVENLWDFTAAGADMVIFSGGKTLCGPQTSGLIVGKKRYLKSCIRFGAPMHGICRSSKTSRESMIGLCVALENYVFMNHQEIIVDQDVLVEQLLSAMDDCKIFETFIVDRGPVGQTYNRAFGRITEPSVDIKQISKKMYEKGIYIGVDEKLNSIYFSPLNINQTECQVTITCLKETVGELMNGRTS